MKELRIKCSVVSNVQIILKVEIATNEITDYKTPMKLILQVIELSKLHKGFTINTEEAIVVETDEEYPFATGCYLKFETHTDALGFVESIDPSNLN
ncbi:MAG: hypothetical protein J6N78_06795 [Clostridia bacterium]|nr:hypothetical protein [Clostridia bacterium]